MTPVVMEFAFGKSQDRWGQGVSCEPSAECRSRNGPPAQATGTLPRITRLMALAIYIEELVRRGEVRDYAEAARLSHVTRARMSQIMNLLNLAPDIQEQILCASFHAITERDLRTIAVLPCWRGQRVRWKSVANGKDDA